MSIGSDIDKAYERIRKAKRRLSKVDGERSRLAKKVHEQFVWAMYETADLDNRHKATWVWGAYRIHCDTLRVEFSTRDKHTRSATIGFSSALYERYKGENRKDGPAYDFVGDEAIIAEVLATYPMMIKAILDAYAARIEGHADATESRAEVGLHTHA